MRKGRRQPPTQSQTILTVEEFISAGAVLSRIFNESRPDDPRITYRMAATIRELKRHEGEDAPHNVAIAKLREKHGALGEDGRYTFTSEGVAAFNADYKSIAGEPLALNLTKWPIEMFEKLKLEKPLSPTEMWLIEWIIDEPRDEIEQQAT